MEKATYKDMKKYEEAMDRIYWRCDPMMRKRKGYPVYPLTAAQKFHFFYYELLSQKGSAEHRHQPDHRDRN